MVVGVASGDLRSRRTFGSRAILSEISKSRDKGEISYEVTKICARACPPPTLTRSPTPPSSDLLPSDESCTRASFSPSTTSVAMRSQP
ncbi:hypothetical protein L484_000067 [Morus notabilis]|uniref:Uncharacterized protein n=1 Tax=Morus notabilis TaxID=981085 RepID=W9T338_9ROSA|nr:hypothetical protein L484_000067 [Morus notabilis]